MGSLVSFQSASTTVEIHSYLIECPEDIFLSSVHFLSLRKNFCPMRLDCKPVTSLWRTRSVCIDTKKKKKIGQLNLFDLFDNGKTPSDIDGNILTGQILQIPTSSSSLRTASPTPSPSFFGEQKNIINCSIDLSSIAFLMLPECETSHLMLLMSLS